MNGIQKPTSTSSRGRTTSEHEPKSKHEREQRTAQVDGGDDDDIGAEQKRGDARHGDDDPLRDQDDRQIDEALVRLVDAEAGRDEELRDDRDAQEGDHRACVPRDSRYRGGCQREHERRQREHELQRQRVGEVEVDPLVVAGNLAHEDRVLSEAPERGDEGRGGQSEGEDPELALAELAGHDHKERKGCELRAEVGNGPVDRVGEDALGALAHRVKTPTARLANILYLSI